ncbi:hypothetical protein CH338_25815, partial [Rhodoplanes elegans]
LSTVAPPPAQAAEPRPADPQADAFAAKATSGARLAYVTTGNAEVDAISKAGLQSLTVFLGQRTALEGGEPLGLDIARDELAFFPLIYWPIVPDAPKPSAQALARVDAYMKQGGTILFDTRDAVEAAPGAETRSPGMVALRGILSSLDIPELEPIPREHVLTKTFFLLRDFPGRFTAGRLWVEAMPAADPDGPDERRPARAGDGQIAAIYAARAARWDAGAGPQAYRGADLVAEALLRMVPDGALDIADAGCGTGLVGALLKSRARRLDGVDLSAPMLERARDKGLYDALVCGDLVGFLAERPSRYDAIACAATLIHFGDLGPPLAAAAAALRDGGVFAATLFPNPDDADAIAVGSLDGLAQGGCFVHGRAYVERAAAAAGFAVEIAEEAVHETQAGRSRTALVVGLRRRPREG